MKFFLLALICTIANQSFAQQDFYAGSEWLTGRGERWVYEPGDGLSIDVNGAFHQLSITNPDGSKAISEGRTLKLGLYFPVTMSPVFDFGVRLSYRDSDSANKANDELITESTKLTGMGPGLEMRYYRFVVGADLMFEKARFKTDGALTNDEEMSFMSTQYYVGIDIPIRPFQLRILWQRGKATIDSSESNLSQDAPLDETNWMIGLRYSTDFGWKDLKRLLLF